jgi:hypothetical protein
LTIAITQPPQNPIQVLIAMGTTSTPSAPTATCTRMSTGAVLCTNSPQPFIDAAAALRLAGVDPSTHITFFGISGNPVADNQLVDINNTPRAGNGQ